MTTVVPKRLDAVHVTRSFRSLVLQRVILYSGDKNNRLTRQSAGRQCIQSVVGVTLSCETTANAK